MRCLLLALLLSACATDAETMMMPPAPEPTVPVGPYDADVAAADVSILYPLGDGLVRSDVEAAFGRLVPAQVGEQFPLTTADLRLVGLRLDPCSARGGCTPEVRAVFQPVDGTAADAAAHVIYDVPADELTVMLKQILTLKKAYGAGVAYPAELGVQPILAASGLDGELARGLRSVIREHLGASRVARVTAFVHINVDEDGWTFTQFERGYDGSFVQHTIVDVEGSSQTMLGTNVNDGSVGAIRVDAQTNPTLPALGPIVDYLRPETVTPEITTAFAAAQAALDPAVRTAENTDCGSCHLVEGALRAGIDLYGLQPSGTLPAYRRDNKTLTNLHAFGYLGTSVAVMQRTAVESVAVAASMQSTLAE